jgi:mono/diheme cytochrome c family protein
VKVSTSSVMDCRLAQDDALFASPSKLTQSGGEAIYNAICAGCHMPEGVGAVGAGRYPALAKNANLESAGYPIYVIIHGQKAMPPLGGLLSDQQIADVVGYIRTNFGNAFAEPVALEEVTSSR